MMTPGRHRDAVPGLPARAAGEGLDRPDHPDRHGPGARAGARRVPGRPVLVALDLLRQRADRHRGVRVRCAVPAGAPASRRPGRSTSPGFVLCGVGLAAGALRALARARARLEVAGGPRRPGSSAACWRSCSSTRVELRKPAPDARAAAAARPACSATPTSSSRSRTPASSAVLFLMPLFLQELRGLTALRVRPHDVPAGHRRAGLVADRRAALPVRRSPTPDGRSGWSARRVTLLTFTQVDLGTDLWVIRGLMFTRGVFMAFAFIPLQAATFATITPADTGRATAIFSTQRQVAGGVRGGDWPPPSWPRPRHAGWPTVGRRGPGRASRPGERATTTCSRPRACWPSGPRPWRWFIRDEDAAATMRAARRPRWRGPRSETHRRPDARWSPDAGDRSRAEPEMDSGPELPTRPGSGGASGPPSRFDAAPSSGATPPAPGSSRPVAGPCLPCARLLASSLHPVHAYRPVRTSPSGWWAFGLDPFR